MELCIALDLPTKNENLDLVNKLKKYDNIWLKVGLRTFIRDGEDFLKAIKVINPNFKIFLDLKLYDIPNTMADAAESIINLDIDMFNIHASAGKVAMQTVMDRVNKYKKRPIVLAVTALTSFSNDEFIDIYNQTINTKANQFAKDAMDSGLDGVVCSAYESLSIKSITNNNFLTLSPGIRPFGEDTDDQKRVADIEFAYKNLVDFIVVGRPIYKADDPSKVVEQILNKIKDNIS